MQYKHSGQDSCHGSVCALDWVIWSWTSSKLMLGRYIHRPLFKLRKRHLAAELRVWSVRNAASAFSLPPPPLKNLNISSSHSLRLQHRVYKHKSTNGSSHNSRDRTYQSFSRTSRLESRMGISLLVSRDWCYLCTHTHPHFVPPHLPHSLFSTATIWWSRPLSLTLPIASCLKCVIFLFQIMVLRVRTCRALCPSTSQFRKWSRSKRLRFRSHQYSQLFYLCTGFLCHFSRVTSSLYYIRQTQGRLCQ